MQGTPWSGRTPGWASVGRATFGAAWTEALATWSWRTAWTPFAGRDIPWSEESPTSPGPTRSTRRRFGRRGSTRSAARRRASRRRSRPRISGIGCWSHSTTGPSVPGIRADGAGRRTWPRRRGGGGRGPAGGRGRGGLARSCPRSRDLEGRSGALQGDRDRPIPRAVRGITPRDREAYGCPWQDPRFIPQAPPRAVPPRLLDQLEVGHAVAGGGPTRGGGRLLPDRAGHPPGDGARPQQSRFRAHPGQLIGRGDRIGLMGSGARSGGAPTPERAPTPGSARPRFRSGRRRLPSTGISFLCPSDSPRKPSADT